MLPELESMRITFIFTLVVFEKLPVAKTLTLVCNANTNVISSN